MNNRGLQSLIGLEDLKAMASRDILASRRAGEPYPHTGLFGPGGLGKTAFAKAIAYNLQYHFFRIEGAAIRNRKTLIELLIRASVESDNMGQRLLFFIDEAHRLGALQEVLYYPIDEHRITRAEGDITFRPFTLIAATTNPNSLYRSFLRRLGNRWHLKPYHVIHIKWMVAKWLRDHNLGFDSDVVTAIARRSLGNPSQALDTLCKKIRNEMLSKGDECVSLVDCQRTFDLEGIDIKGLTDIHRRYLRELARSEGVPKGLSAIAGKLGEDEDVVSGSIEPILLSLNMIDLTGRGRVLTSQGSAHLKEIG